MTRWYHNSVNPVEYSQSNDVKYNQEIQPIHLENDAKCSSKIGNKAPICQRNLMFEPTQITLAGGFYVKKQNI